MELKDYCRPAWKAAMRMLLRFYLRDMSISLLNHRKMLSEADAKKWYGDTAGASGTAEEFYSAHGQDAYVLHVIYKGKPTGTFVDIGANHPIRSNNSYLLERHGWKGVAVEPQKSLNRLWPEARKTPCLACVVGPENKNVTFVEGDPKDHERAGVEGFNKVNAARNMTVLPQRRLSDIMAEHNITEVDYLSIDVEGYELNVLQGVDFASINIRLIGVENDSGFKFLPVIGEKLGFELGSNKLRRFLKAKGYKHIGRIVGDDFFLKVVH